MRRTRLRDSTTCPNYAWPGNRRLRVAVKRIAKGNLFQTILRTGVVVGLGGGMIQSIWLPFKLGVGGPLGTGKQIMPWIHMQDLCSLIQYIIEKPVRGVVNAVAPEIASNKDFSKAFAKALNRPCIFNVPEFVVHAIFGNDRAALLLSGAKVEPKEAIASGFKFQYPSVNEAVKELTRKR
ncbi:uncharacterized protein Dana_GF13097, isoform B [Drosophila ananassae]|uniref:Uncharacterized protein, isoform B n=1 Tax=Drosophila ananassae TaxID=7217 RepID=A0A0P9AEK2_DROAN|nr:uncharacterized protein Dana_GF13097, isoform B [Drosophila ananassae]